MMTATKDKLLIGGMILLVIVGLFALNFLVKKGEQKTQQAPIKSFIATRATSVEPLQNQKGLSVVPQVVVTFSSSVSGKKVSLKTDPAIDFRAKVDKEGKKATFSPKTKLTPNTTYNLQVFIEGQPIFSWIVTTGNIGSSQASLAVAVTKIRDQLPFAETGIRISYDAATDQFFVFIEAAPYQTFKEKADAWFKDEGLEDFVALRINYVTQGSLR